MSGFNNHFGIPTESTSSLKPTNGLLNLASKNERRNGRPPPSLDQVQRGEQTKIEGEHDECSSLTSQTLNADGTPKRPMNAFMIFARRRRPQVSAENQSMRTGEISKILSREWVSMLSTEKQFYLEQAKQLKETFNTKYPDYVYRRRPNNSRKRRRSDGGSLRSVDPSFLGDHPDDMSGSFDLESSPTDGEDLDTLYPRPVPDMSQGIMDQKFSLSQPRSGLSHPYSSSDHHFRSDTHDGSRLPYTGSNSTDRIGSNISNSSSPPISLNALQYSYGPQSSHAQSSPLFGADSVGSQQGWQQRGSSWLSGGQERLPPPASMQKHGSYSSSNWSTPSDTSAGATGSSNYFPTLNTPFYPHQSNVSSFSTSTNSSHSLQQSSTSSHFENLSAVSPSTMPRDFSSRGHGSSLSSSGNSYTLGRDPFAQRTLPPMQTLPGYSSSQAITSSGNSGPPPAFWRD